MYELDADERDNFRRIAEVAFANPFGAERRRLDRRFAGVDDPSVARPEVVDRMLERLRRCLRPLPPEGEKRVDLCAVDDGDRDRVEYALLFEQFHRWAEHVDAHITDQLECGDEPLEVGFADELIGELTRAGIDTARAHRIFALFFQLRRAFYFISERLVGDSEPMRAIRRQLWNDVFGDDIRFYERTLWDRLEEFSVLFTGPTGTGKGTAASAVGYSGWIPFEPERGQFAVSFTTLYHPTNLAEYAESVIESELFGHVEGAFTGAVADRPGVFDRTSSWGTVFLDEISEVPEHIQVKLLRVLEDRRFTPVGSHQPRTFQGRTLASTNRRLEEALDKGLLREDLFYRLCSDVVAMPTLRRRLDDHPEALETLVAHTVDAELAEPAPDRHAAIAEAIRESRGDDYSWPGNVRELQQCVRRYLLAGTCPPAADPTADADDSGEQSTPEAFQTGRWTADELLGHYCAHLYDRLGSYADVGRQIDLDRRTVKRYIDRLDDDSDVPH